MENVKIFIEGKDVHDLTAHKHDNSFIPNRMVVPDNVLDDDEEIGINYTVYRIRENYIVMKGIVLNYLRNHTMENRICNEP